jgi:hypothetical protein
MTVDTAIAELTAALAALPPEQGDHHGPLAARVVAAQDALREAIAEAIARAEFRGALRATVAQFPGLAGSLTPEQALALARDA